jgi:hypothetical protein
LFYAQAIEQLGIDIAAERTATATLLTSILLDNSARRDGTARPQQARGDRKATAAATLVADGGAVATSAVDGE